MRPASTFSIIQLSNSRDLWAAVWLMSGEMPSGDFMIENKKM